MRILVVGFAKQSIHIARPKDIQHNENPGGAWLWVDGCDQIRGSRTGGPGCRVVGWKIINIIQGVPFIFQDYDTVWRIENLRIFNYKCLVLLYAYMNALPILPST